MGKSFTEADVAEFLRERLKEIAQRTQHYSTGKRCPLWQGRGHKAGRRYAIMKVFPLDPPIDDSLCILCPFAEGPEYHEETSSKSLWIPHKSYPICNHDTRFHAQAALLAPASALYGVPRPISWDGHPVANGTHKTMNIAALGGDLWPEMFEDFEDHWMKVAFAPLMDVWKRECTKDFEEAMLHRA